MFISIIGGGPAGLRAAEVAAATGARVAVFERQRSVGRKFLVAGKGGLNLTHDEPPEAFAARYLGDAQPPGIWSRLLAGFSADDLRAWASGLGVETFTATSGRVYPRELKAAALLRGWVRRLRAQGVEFHIQHRLVAIDAETGLTLRFDTPEGTAKFHPDAAVLALGGGSWPETGSDGSWVEFLQARGVRIAPLQSANCGWEIAWPPGFPTECEGQPLKNIAARAGENRAGGELLLTRYGLEGGAIYQLGPALRAMPEPLLHLDFKPQLDADRLARKLTGVLRDWWPLARERWRLSPAAAAVLTHLAGVEKCTSVLDLAHRVKDCPIPLLHPRPLAEAISTAGGVCWDELNEHLMIRRLPGVFVAGEMIDWEAPTGGYLLQGAFAMGTHAGAAAASYGGQKT